MTEFNERIEGEIKTHEAEMLRKAVIAKYGAKTLRERIIYVMERYREDKWSAGAMFARLSETGLNGTDTIQDVKNIFKAEPKSFPESIIDAD